MCIWSFFVSLLHLAQTMIALKWVQTSRCSPIMYGNYSSSTLCLMQSFVCMALTLSAFNIIGSGSHARRSFVRAIILVVPLIFELLTFTFTIADTDSSFRLHVDCLLDD